MKLTETYYLIRLVAAFSIFLDLSNDLLLCARSVMGSVILTSLFTLKGN